LIEGPGESRVRELAEAEYGERFEDEYWDRLAARGYGIPDADLEAADPSGALADAVREAAGAYRDLFGGLPRPVARQEVRAKDAADTSRLSALRASVLSDLYAAEAGASEIVQHFRAEVLSGKLLPAEPDEESRAAVRGWIEAQEPNGWEHVGTLLGERHPLSEPRPERDYGIPEPLRELHRVTERLAQDYDWSKPDATRFVLTGRTPAVYPIRGAVRLPRLAPSTSRVTLVIDPAITPAEVAEFYQRTRKRFVYGPHQFRPLQEKALHLARFWLSATRLQTGGSVLDRTWDGDGADLVRRWNAQYPDQDGHQWEYDASNADHVRNFRRDIRQAVAKLLYPKIRE
jgi:hypothetical protein